MSLEEAREQLRRKSLELLDAPVGKVAALTIQVQRLRVTCAILREVETGVTDANTYKEMTLLNKLVTGKDLESEATKEQQAEDEAAATARLEERGIAADSAQRITRVLQSVMGARDVGPRPIDDDKDRDESADDPGK